MRSTLVLRRWRCRGVAEKETRGRRRRRETLQVRGADTKRSSIQEQCGFSSCESYLLLCDVQCQNTVTGGSRGPCACTCCFGKQESPCSPFLWNTQQRVPCYLGQHPHYDSMWPWYNATEMSQAIQLRVRADFSIHIYSCSHFNTFFTSKNRRGKNFKSMAR